MNDNRSAIPKIAADAPDFDFESIRGRQRPVILTDATDDWPARGKWSLDYFAEQLGDREYLAELDLPTDVPVSYRLDDFQREVRMRDFIQTVKNSDSDRASYITNKSIDRFPGMAPDVQFERLVGQPVREDLTKLWIGTANTKSSLHFDWYENLLCQLIGRKRVYLIDPAETSNLYQYASNIDKSRIDVEDPNLERFPRFRNVIVHEGVLEEGDLLLIPMLWWHSVRSLSPSISVNCFYGPSAGERELVPMMFAGGIRPVAAFVRDFFWSGLLGRPWPQRLYASEPFGVWFYCQARDSIARRTNRLLGRRVAQ